MRVVAVVAMGWGGAYLVWRVGWTGQDTNPVLFVSLLAAELVGWANLGFFAFLAWRVPRCDPPPVTTLRTVDIVVPTYDEPVEVLRATLIGCRAVRHPHRTWLLDDGRRPEMEELARELGARYLTRPDNAHAKAGNINHALPLLDGELVAVLDADHVPLPDFLDDLVGHFDDWRVALVQAPHEFYNLDSVQHVEGDIHEQSLFFRVICPGKSRHDGVFWCGSGTVIRRSALLEVGGVLTKTIAEDFHTTIALHQRGWRTRYVDRTVLLGLAPHDLGAFLLQRRRWARGNLKVLLTRESPLWARGLQPLQRLSYLGSLSNYLGGPQRLAMLCVLIATLVTGSLPLHGEPWLFAVLWAPWVLLSLGTTKVLGRGYVGPVSATAYGWMTMGVYTTAVLSLVVPGGGPFQVTPKTGTSEGGLRVLGFLRLLTTFTVVLVAAVTLRGAAVVGWLDLPSMPTFALFATLAIAAFELVVIVLVLRSLARHRQRRTAYRFPVDLPARGEDGEFRIIDLNHHGAGVLTSGDHRPGERLALTFALPGLDGRDRPVTVTAEVRSVHDPRGAEAEGGATARLGVEFRRVTPEASQRIMEYCHVLAPARRAALTEGTAPHRPTPVDRPVPARSVWHPVPSPPFDTPILDGPIPDRPTFDAPPVHTAPPGSGVRPPRRRPLSRRAPLDAVPVPADRPAPASRDEASAPA